MCNYSSQSLISGMYACVVSIYVPLYIEMKYNQYSHTLTWYQRVTIRFRIPRAPPVHARRSADSLAWSAAEPIAAPNRTSCPASAAADPSPPVGPRGLPALRPSSARSPPPRRVRGARGPRGLPRPATPPRGAHVRLRFLPRRLLVRCCSPPDPHAPPGLLVFADPAGSLLAPTSSRAAGSLVPLLATAMDEAAAAAAKAAEDRRLAEYEATHEAVWAQATAVVNVKALIPIILDKATNTYTKWRGIFLTVLGKYALTRHVLDDEMFPERPAWLQADCVVLTWIYDTVSGDLQQSLLIRQRPAREAWCYLEDEFLGQKESRTLLLETQFRNLRQDSMLITEFCRRLETMAASLAEFGDPIGDRQMVLTLLRGLSGKFRHMVSILKMHRPFSMFTEARTHLLLEEMEIDARPPSPPTALVVHQQQATSCPSSTPRQGNPSATQQRSHGVPTGGQRTNGRRRGRGGRGGGQQPPGRGTPSTGQGSAPPGMHPSFAQPCAGSLQMWPYGRPPPQPTFTVFPQYGGSFGSVPDGGVYGTGYTAPPPYVYGGAVHSPSTFQGPPAPYQAAAHAPWNPTYEAHGTGTPSCSHSTP
jgi:hypothetical protein